MSEEWFSPDTRATYLLDYENNYRAFLRSFSSEAHDFFDAGDPESDGSSETFTRRLPIDWRPG
jgi:hypothetical protein